MGRPGLCPERRQGGEEQPTRATEKGNAVLELVLRTETDLRAGATEGSRLWLNFWVCAQGRWHCFLAL